MKGEVSTVSAIFFIIATDSIGYAPAAVSPDSIIASVPSNIAFATSLVSARVGIGFSIMLSSICVATITTLRLIFAFLIIVFCTIGTFSVDISIPKSPLATIMPSDTSIISSIFSTACGFSILEMILMWSQLFDLRILRNKTTSCASLTNERPR